MGDEILKKSVSRSKALVLCVSLILFALCIPSFTYSEDKSDVTGVILMKVAMMDEIQQSGKPVFYQVASKPLNHSIIIERVQSNMFFYPAVWIEAGLKLRIEEVNISTWGDWSKWDSPKGLVHFHQIHQHHGVIYGEEQCTVYPNILVEEGSRFYFYVVGTGERDGDAGQQFAWLCYIWYRRA